MPAPPLHSESNLSINENTAIQPTLDGENVLDQQAADLLRNDERLWQIANFLTVFDAQFGINEPENSNRSYGWFHGASPDECKAGESMGDDDMNCSTGNDLEAHTLNDSDLGPFARSGPVQNSKLSKSDPDCGPVPGSTANQCGYDQLASHYQLSSATATTSLTGNVVLTRTYDLDSDLTTIHFDDDDSCSLYQYGYDQIASFYRLQSGITKTAESADHSLSTSIVGTVSSGHYDLDSPFESLAVSDTASKTAVSSTK